MRTVLPSKIASAAVVIAAAASSVCAAPPQAAPPSPLPRGLKEWAVEYSVTGGIRPYTHSVSVTSDGALVGIDTNARHHIIARASAEVVAKVAAFLNHAHTATRVVPGPDQRVTDLVLKTGGKDYLIAGTPEIFQVLDNAFGVAVADGLIGEWRESEWKLCTPVPQLAPGDIDAAIDTLAFKNDGSFSVTWPGGPRTTGVPHVQVPDYYGRYTLEPAQGYFQMRIEGGRFIPTDVVNKGQFGIADGTLIIRNAWFGTKQARKKPDICELTFVRK